VICREQTKGLLLRLPLDVKDWLEKEAARTLASQNNEVIRILRAQMENQRERVSD
jgi:hypothetical protein